MKKTIKLELNVTGTCTDSELSEFIKYELGGGSMNFTNPFHNEDGDAEVEIIDLEIEN